MHSVFVKSATHILSFKPLQHFTITTCKQSNLHLDIMSGNVRSRAQGRGNQPNRGQPSRGRAIPQLDGPASRGGASRGSGTGSAAGTQSQISGPPPSQSPSAAPSQSQAAIPMARDPAREGARPRATDVIKNVDMPASFYNIDNQVSHFTRIQSQVFC